MSLSPTLHLAAGFLGSGKTTAIINACKSLVRQNLRVGVVTNDQGKYLVDTAFFRLAELPTVEVGGGCFCCNYVDLDKQLDVLLETVQPDVVFAESVGSCGDLVATVVKPLKEFKHNQITPTSFSVFTDARLLRMRLLDVPLPFSDDVIYIFDQQIAESELVVINKVDLLKNGQSEQVLSLAKDRWPDKQFIQQVSLSEMGISAWLDLLQSGHAPIPAASLEMDYARYGQGEQRLAWIDEKVRIYSNNIPLKLVAAQLISAVLNTLNEQRLPIGHVKFVLTAAGGGEGKVSFTTLDQPGWDKEIPALVGNELTVLINGRVECPAKQLDELIHKAIVESTEPKGLIYEILESEAFHPAQPQPTYRM